MFKRGDADEAWQHRSIVAGGIYHFLLTEAKASQYHSSDLSPRLKRWAESTDQTQPIHAVTKQDLETYLAQYSAQNYVNHRAALSNLFGYSLKVGAVLEKRSSEVTERRERTDRSNQDCRLSPCGRSPGRAGKAAFFLRFGFTIADWRTFADALMFHARFCQVTKLSESRFGTKYQIDGPLPCPDGRSPAIRAVWIVDAGTDFPRLITAHPLE